MPVIVDGITKSYGTKRVLDDVSFTVPDGGHICITGESGCGKTTLLRIILGLEKPDGGSVSGIAGHTLAAAFQENRLIEHIGAAANIRFTSPKSAAEALLAEVGLYGDDTLKPVCSLSGGMRRRVALVRALAADAQIIFLDEPFRELDELNRRAAAVAAAKYSAGKTLFLVSHDPSDTSSLGCRLLRLPTLSASDEA